MAETSLNVSSSTPRKPLSRWWIGGPLLVLAVLVSGKLGWDAWKLHQFEKERTETPPHVIADLKLKMLWIPAGTFTMGTEDEAEWLKSVKQKYNDLKPTGWAEWQVKGVDPNETPATVVTLTKGFYLGETEVTQAQWEVVMGSNPSRSKGMNRPVEKVSWDDCVLFCQKLTQRERAAGRLEPKQVYRLPTEAEWEYACRAGSGGEFCFGNDESKLGLYAWYGDNSGVETLEVGTKRANAWGLHDLHGNVWEWCADVWDAKAYSKRSTGWGAEEWTVSLAGSDVKFYDDEDKANNLPLRVVRGGSFCYAAGFCRSAYRCGWRPRNRNWNHGFRLALVPGPVVAE